MTSWLPGWLHTGSWPSSPKTGVCNFPCLCGRLGASLRGYNIFGPQPSTCKVIALLSGRSANLKDGLQARGGPAAWDTTFHGCCSVFGQPLGVEVTPGHQVIPALPHSFLEAVTKSSPLDSCPFVYVHRGCLQPLLAPKYDSPYEVFTCHDKFFVLRLG